MGEVPSAGRRRPRVVERPRRHRPPVADDPATSVNYAFFAHDAFATASWPLADRNDILVDMVLNHEYTVNWHL
jgi:hypothetical protein